MIEPISNLPSTGTPAQASVSRAGRLLVVTPTLGSSVYLDQTVESVTSQSINILHVLVTPESMVAPLQARYRHAVVLADAGKEAGLYGAINVALTDLNQEWEWFTYINDDDL